MPDEGIQTKVSVLGDKEYKAALSDITRQLTVLNTDMTASQSAFAGQADSMEAVRSKLQSLQAEYLQNMQALWTQGLQASTGNSDGTIISLMAPAVTRPTVRA